MNVVAYFIGWKLLGRKFIIYSAVAAVSFSVFYRIFECFPHIYPDLYKMPLVAAIIGAVFVGVGTGIAIRFGGAVCGDDAIAMSISHVTGLKIEWVYLISDVTILGLSLTYIPLTRILYSLLTVVLSGQIIGFIQRIGKKK